MKGNQEMIYAYQFYPILPKQLPCISLSHLAIPSQTLANLNSDAVLGTHVNKHFLVVNDWVMSYLTTCT